MELVGRVVEIMAGVIEIMGRWWRS